MVRSFHIQRYINWLTYKLTNDSPQSSDGIPQSVSNAYTYVYMCNQYKGLNRLKMPLAIANFPLYSIWLDINSNALF